MSKARASAWAPATSCRVRSHGVSLSGHDLKNISSFYEYQRTHIGRFTAGAAVHAGYPAPPWGSTGFGPKCVDVAALRVCGVDLRDEDTKMAFVHLILDLFRLDSASPPALLPSGEFMKPVVEGQLEGGWWPLVVSSSGSVVMYRPERIAANPVEMREVQLALVKAMQRALSAALLDLALLLLPLCRQKRCSASGRGS